MKIQLNHKLKSGALQFTVFVAVLIALLLSGLILYAYTFGYMKEQSKAAIENIQLSDTAIAYLLEQSEISKDTLTIDFINKEKQTVKVQVSPWGIFEKAVAVTQHRKKIFTKLAIIGSTSSAANSPTLFLQEILNPLSLVGNTKIKGTAYLPSQGVKSGYIAGNSYYGSQLIYGKIERSASELPQLHKKTLDQLAFYNNEYKPRKQEENINLEATRRLVNSFKARTKNVYSKDVLVLKDVTFTGNIVIKSDTLIIIKKTAFLKDLIVIAPIIEIESGTTGNFQALATKRITVGKDCTLNYPSALVLYQDNKLPKINISNIPFDNQIFIDAASIIKGSVCYLQTKTESDYNAQIVLEKQSRIKGQVYCNGNFELKGTVSGSVYTKQFIANQAGSIFINHIYEGTIENENVPAFFGGIVFEKERKTVMKWLY